MFTSRIYNLLTSKTWKSSSNLNRCHDEQNCQLSLNSWPTRSWNVNNKAAILSCKVLERFVIMQQISKIMFVIRGRRRKAARAASETLFFIVFEPLASPVCQYTTVLTSQVTLLGGQQGCSSDAALLAAEPVFLTSTVYCDWWWWPQGGKTMSLQGRQGVGPRAQMPRTGGPSLGNLGLALLAFWCAHESPKNHVRIQSHSMRQSLRPCMAMSSPVTPTPMNLDHNLNVCVSRSVMPDLDHNLNSKSLKNNQLKKTSFLKEKGQFWYCFSEI